MAGGLMNGAVDAIYNYIVNKPIFFVVIVVLAIMGVMYLIQGKKAYCFVRILEKRGDTFVDHGRVYKAHILSVRDPETGNKIQWLHIAILKKNWKIPKADELTPTLKGQRLATLAWFGGNDFRLIKLSTYVYKKVGDKLYKKLKITQKTLRIIPDDLKHLDYQVSNQIDQLMYKGNWFDKYLKPHMTLIIVGFLCVMMVWIVTTKMAEKMDATGDKVENLGERFVSYIQTATSKKVDDKTTVTSNLDDDGGG